MVERSSLCGNPRLVFYELTLSLWREQYCPMPVGFKINTNIVVLCSMVQVLDPSGHATHRETLVDDT